MKLFKLILIALGIAIAIAISPAITRAQNSPAVTVNYVYYQIGGSTAAQLRAQMDTLGPFDAQFGNRRYDALTRWYGSWRYSYIVQNNRCTIERVLVNTNVTITLPQWNPPSQASRQLQRKWNRYIQALQTHENGHKQHGIEAGKEIFKLLNNLPSYRSCQDLQTAANNKSNQIIAKYNQRDIDYDRRTQHGRTQGATFP
jgi:predicted secreted Zn-dependent protease